MKQIFDRNEDDDDDDDDDKKEMTTTAGKTYVCSINARYI